MKYVVAPLAFAAAFIAIGGPGAGCVDTDDCRLKLTCDDGVVSSVGGGGAGGAAASGQGGAGGGASKAVGDTCQNNGECDSAYCVDDHCCESVCEGTCYTCADPAQLGSCVVVAAMLDPNNDCLGSASCDGAGQCAYGETRFAAGFGDAGAQNLNALTVTSGGAIITGGSFLSELPLPGQTLVSTGVFDGWHARWTQSGVLSSAGRYGDFSLGKNQFVNSVAESVAGQTYVGGSFEDVIYVASGEQLGSGFTSYVARIEPLAQQQASVLSHSGGLFGCPIIFASPVANELLLHGACSAGQFSFQSFSQTIAQPHIALVKLTSLTQLAWAKFFVSSGSGTSSRKPVVGSDGSIYLYGRADGVITLDGGSVVSFGTNPFVAQLTSDGLFSWALTIASNVDGVVEAVHLRPDGSLVAVGSFSGTIISGRGNIDSQGGTDAFVAEVAADGTLLSVRTFGGPADDSFTSVEIDSAGLMMVAGHTEGDIDLGGGVLPGHGLRDILVAKFAADGSHVWSRVFGSTGNDKLAEAAIGLGDTVVLAGDYFGPIDFGLGTISHAGDGDVFLAILGP